VQAGQEVESVLVGVRIGGDISGIVGDRYRRIQNDSVRRIGHGAAHLRGVTRLTNGTLRQQQGNPQHEA
jgi:hypothetical protein